MEIHITQAKLAEVNVGDMFVQNSEVYMFIQIKDGDKALVNLGTGGLANIFYADSLNDKDIITYLENNLYQYVSPKDVVLTVQKGVGA